MTPSPEGNLAHSVQSRLKNAAAEAGRPFAEVLERYAAERLSEGFASHPLHGGRWRAFLAKGDLEGSEGDFVRVVASIRDFASPVLEAVRVGASFEQKWTPDGPWG